MDNGPPIITGKHVKINLNDETGKDFYSIEYADDPGNWINSFTKKEQALNFIKKNQFQFNIETDFRDSRTTPWWEEKL